MFYIQEVHMKTNDPTPPIWYKQFWPWFLLSIPAAAILLSMLMITLAIKGKDALVSDDYYKDGLAINRELAKDHQASKLGIEAKILHTEQGMLSVEFSNSFDIQPPFLILKLIHPTVAGQDQQVTLMPSNNRYSVRLPEPLSGRWNIHLLAHDTSWRVKGKLSLPSTDWTPLQPEL